MREGKGGRGSQGGESRKKGWRRGLTPSIRAYSSQSEDGIRELFSNDNLCII